MEQSDWTEILITVPIAELEIAGGIAHMAVPYGIYVEDYSDLEQEVLEIAHIDLIDEALLRRDRINGIIHIYVSPEERPSEALQFLRERYAAAGIPHEIALQTCKNADWENNWKQYFKPLPVGQKLLIRPAWEEDCDAAGRVVLSLDPGSAFGTGTHDTTRLCLEALERHVTPGCTVLDVGCGSGILSIAALLLGAGHATGIDIDALAVKAARQNAAANRLNADQFTVLQGNLAEQVEGSYDIVIANLVTDIILSLLPNIPVLLKPSGMFIASGIILQRKKDIRAALEANGPRVTACRESDGWLCIEMENTP